LACTQAVSPSLLQTPTPPIGHILIDLDCTYQNTKILHESVYYLFLTFLLVSKGKIETVRWLVPVSLFFTVLTLKGQRKAIQSHGSTFVELDYTMNGLYNHISPLAVTMATYVKDYLDLLFGFHH